MCDTTEWARTVNVRITKYLNFCPPICKTKNSVNMRLTHISIQHSYVDLQHNNFKLLERLVNLRPTKLCCMSTSIIKTMFTYYVTCWNVFSCMQECRSMPSYWTDIEDIQSFDVEYGIYFTSETEFLYFHDCKGQLKLKYIKKESCLRGETDSLFKVTNLIFSIYYIFLYVWHLRWCMYNT